jgi:hypothetical protein
VIDPAALEAAVRDAVAWIDWHGVIYANDDVVDELRAALHDTEVGS